MRSKSQKIALAFPIAIPHLERVIRGILDYAHAHSKWSFTRLPEMLSPSIQWLKHWPGDGAFILVTQPGELRVARTLRFPVINLAAHVAEPRIPSVTVDHAATGRLAAEHLLERHFRRFGFYGTRGKWFSAQRRDGFGDRVKREGYPVDLLEVNDFMKPRSRWNDQESELDAWLKRLQRPIGILASTDLRATMVNDACQRVGLRVPEDVALIGVDNDTVACEQCRPSLSSVSRNDWKVGWEAGRMMHRLMRGADPLQSSLRIPPDAVIARGSTRTLAIEDPAVSKAVQDIQAHLGQAFGVERLIEVSGLSRRRLEVRFQQCLGRSPYTFINEQRVDLAKHLLADPTPRTLTDIAASCGFAELRRFRLVFERCTGTTPAAFRRTRATSAK